MSERDRWRWHAYDYAWRRVQAKLRVLQSDPEHSPIDINSQWKDTDMIQEAYDLWRRFKLDGTIRGGNDRRSLER